jgi:predicted transcriptional regulator
MATTGNNVRVPDDLFAELEMKASAEGRTADELVADAVRQSLRDRSWNDLLARGREYGAASGIQANDVIDEIHDWRKKTRGR